MGPKLWLVLRNVPDVASHRYVKPDAGDGSGRLVSWLASATLNCVKFDWNALLKCAECVDPSGSTASLSTTRPLGPNRSWNTSDSVGTGRDCAAACDARASNNTRNVRTRRPMGTLRSCYRTAWCRTDSMTQSAPAWRSASVVMVSLRSC